MASNSNDHDDDDKGASSFLCYDAVSFIDTRRRNERPHTAAELEWWISSYCQGRVTEYQMAAWLMAVCCHGLTPEETAILTACTVNSGVRLQWDHDATNEKDDDNTNGNNDNEAISSPLNEQGIRNPEDRRRRRLPLVDKHSTGGKVLSMCIFVYFFSPSLGWIKSWAFLKPW